MILTHSQPAFLPAFLPPVLLLTRKAPRWQEGTWSLEQPRWSLPRHWCLFLLHSPRTQLLSLSSAVVVAASTAEKWGPSGQPPARPSVEDNDDDDGSPQYPERALSLDLL